MYMALPTIDKATATTIVAATAILAYLAFILIYPDKEMPSELATIAQLGIAWFFVTSSINSGYKYAKSQ